MSWHHPNCNRRSLNPRVRARGCTCDDHEEVLGAPTPIVGPYTLLRHRLRGGIRFEHTSDGHNIIRVTVPTRMRRRLTRDNATDVEDLLNRFALELRALLGRGL